MDKTIPYGRGGDGSADEGKDVAAMGEIFYRVEGAINPADPASSPGLTVMLIHGFAEDGDIWSRQTKALSPYFHLIIPDLPGSGRSTRLPGTTRMEDLADAIRAILDAEMTEACVLIGHSMGGYAGLAFVERYPKRCLALGLFHSTAEPDTEEKKTTRRKSIAFIERHGAAEFIRQSTPNLFADGSKEQHPKWVNAVIERYAAFDPASLIGYYEGMIARPDRTKILRETAQPVLFVIGRHDNTIPLESSLRQSHMPALVMIHILDETGHMGMIEAAGQSNWILDEFLHFVSDRAAASHEVRV